MSSKILRRADNKIWNKVQDMLIQVHAVVNDVVDANTRIHIIDSLKFNDTMFFRERFAIKNGVGEQIQKL